MNPMAVMWLSAMIIFLAAEGATAAVTTIWFAGGALVSMVAALLGAEVWLQIVLFVAVSVILLLSLRPLLKKYINPKKVATNVDAIIGKEGVVLEKIDNFAGTGRVKLGGMEWSARSMTGENIEPGTVIKVEKVEGVKVLVTMQNVQCAMTNS